MNRLPAQLLSLALLLAFGAAAIAATPRSSSQRAAFGLNNKFLQSQFGGFAENVAAEIRKAMAGEAPASWALEDSE